MGWPWYVDMILFGEQAAYEVGVAPATVAVSVTINVVVEVDNTLPVSIEIDRTWVVEASAGRTVEVVV